MCFLMKAQYTCGHRSQSITDCLGRSKFRQRSSLSRFIFGGKEPKCKVQPSEVPAGHPCPLCEPQQPESGRNLVAHVGMPTHSVRKAVAVEQGPRPRINPADQKVGFSYFSVRRQPINKPEKSRISKSRTTASMDRAPLLASRLDQEVPARPAVSQRSYTHDLEHGRQPSRNKPLPLCPEESGLLLLLPPKTCYAPVNRKSLPKREGSWRERAVEQVVRESSSQVRSSVRHGSESIGSSQRSSCPHKRASKPARSNREDRPSFQASSRAHPSPAAYAVPVTSSSSTTTKSSSSSSRKNSVKKATMKPQPRKSRFVEDLPYALTEEAFMMPKERDAERKRMEAAASRKPKAASASSC